MNTGIRICVSVLALFAAACGTPQAGPPRGPAGDVTLGGLADPLALAAFGVLIPYITGGPGGTVASIEVASPVADNPDLHMIFHNASCSHIFNVPFPETANDIKFLDPTVVGPPPGSSGLVAIAGVDITTPVQLKPLTAPIHSRVHLFEAANGRSRVLEPIILGAAESSAGLLTWSPLRTGATFYAPLEGGTVHTELILVCPRTTIQGAVGAVFPTTLFPTITPPFKGGPSAAGDLRVRIYDTDENLLRDAKVSCDCLTQVGVLDISSVYGDAVLAKDGTYTEMEVIDENIGTFTGYRSVVSGSSPLDNSFGRLSPGSRGSLRGPVAVPAR